MAIPAAHDEDNGPENDAGPGKVKPTEAGSMYSAGDVRIVVIDDDPAIGRLVQATLAGQEFNIQVVADPQRVKQTLHCDGKFSGLQRNFGRSLARVLEGSGAKALFSFG